MSYDVRYVRNAWYMAGWGKDFPAGKPTAGRLLNEPLVFYRQADGKLVALEDRCPHRLAPLSMGQVEGDDLRCLYHGVKFSGAGTCLEVPGSNAKPKALCVRPFPVVERESAVFVWMGDPAKADEALLPPFIGFENPGWHMLPGHMDYDVYYELIQDNLLDLSHIAFLHQNSFGGGNAASNKSWADAELRITQLPRGVRVERWMKDAATPPPQAPIVGPLCDVLTSFDYLVPGYFLLHTRYFRVGAAERAGADRPTEEPIFSSWTSQAVTPISDKKTTYYFCFGPWDKQPGAADMKEAFKGLALKAFTEDWEMLTAQQKSLDADPSRKMVLFDVDRAPVLYRRVVDKILAEDA
ncbi:MAG: hypothetical protein RLZZ200_192 [Pseudomonadota bacterium]|jgi:vanillate O-demethylase monooxygenase subunit